VKVKSGPGQGRLEQGPPARKPDALDQLASAWEMGADLLSERKTPIEVLDEAFGDAEPEALDVEGHESSGLHVVPAPAPSPKPEGR
jgi:hypothetical protein